MTTNGARALRAYVAIVAACDNHPGALSRFRPDMTVHDARFIEQTDGAPFVWCLREAGTHIRAVGEEGTGPARTLFGYCKCVAETFSDCLAWYVWTGEGLVPCASHVEAAGELERAAADYAADRQRERAAAPQVLPLSPDDPRYVHWTALDRQQREREEREGST